MRLTLYTKICVASVLFATGSYAQGIIKGTVKDNVTGETRILACSGFFVGIGHEPCSNLFLKLVDVDEAGYIQTEGKTTHTRTEGLFACGDVQDKIYRQAVTAAGSGCAAGIDCTRWLELN